MADLILLYLKLGAVLLISTAVCIKFRHERNFNALGAAMIFSVVMRIAEAWAVFFLIMKPHASRATSDLIQARLDNGFMILCIASFTLAIYYLGGKPSSGFWHWLGDDGERSEMPGAGSKA